MRPKLSTKNSGDMRSPAPVISKLRKARYFAVIMALSLTYQLVFPNVCFALTSGPSSPEFSSFEPVATTNMVNEFTGQFTYNIPVIDIPGASGGGYAMSLSYHSGDGPESEASWVGAGWSLNPGSINRNKRGLPDDFNGQQITYRNNMPPNWTVAATGQVGAELLSDAGLSGNAYATVRYNNYKGFGFTDGFGLSALDGTFSLSFNITDGDGTFSAAVNPAAILSFVSDQSKDDDEEASEKSTKDDQKKPTIGVGQFMQNSVESFVSGAMATGTTRYINYLLADMSSPYNLTPYTGTEIAGAVSATVDPPPFPAGLDLGMNVSYSTQKNIDPRNVPAYGYMYSGNAKSNNSSDSESMMDYTVENPSTFNVRDKYLPIPFSTADAYFVSGEGVGGGFRMYNDRIGLFSPNYVKSQTTHDYFGVDVHVGLDDGVGGEVVVDGKTTLEVHSEWTNREDGNTDNFWFAPYNFRDTLHTLTEPTFFRFNNDMGGKVIYDNSDAPNPAIISGQSPQLPGIQQLQQTDVLPGNYRRSARATYIGYHTNRELFYKTNGIRALAYEKDPYTNTMAGRDDSSNVVMDEIGEIATTNEAGNRYVYGLPVYVGNEKNLQYGLTNATANNYYITNTNNLSSNVNVVGEVYNQPYASQYLLTQVTTPDYVDLNNNGPDDADLGGYTKFSYKRVLGTDNKVSSANYSQWYQWRAPYSGVYFRPNRLSDNTDDMGSYQSGYKEVYYLDTIMTKTHYAVFVTDDAQDGCQSADENSAASGLSSNTNPHKKLTQIQLYAKSTHPGVPDQLIKTVHFDYDYECWPGTPNSSGGQGKLTLKRVWFEYNGVVDAYISPYQFNYSYPTSTYPSQYQYIQTEMHNISAAAQAPSYTNAIDCWGNYQYDGVNRRNRMQSWVSQNPDPSGYDPAAWQLKSIVLPSGGEIHVQYEQNTYSYVQNRNASALVKLSPTATDGTAHSFDLDVEDELGSGVDKNKLVSLINQTYSGQKIYFKFFYSLLNSSKDTIGSCDGDYIDGYANFGGAQINPSTGRVNISLAPGSGNIQYPRDVALDYIHHQVGGKIFNGNCTPSGTTSMSNQFSNVVDWLKGLATELSNATSTALAAKAFACKYINPNISYFRIPLIKKSGGGVRVKRLLMYNPGVDANSSTLYGTQYIYDNESDGSSYGVATNEPAENRGENPLVTFLEKRGDQTLMQELVSGKDKQQFEGPLGWNALPSASIGYSRIIKKNIYQMPNVGAGYTVVDYYTAKDYPFDMVYQSGASGNAFSDIQTVKDDWNIHLDLFKYTVNTGVRSSQAYCFIQNQMHGQLKSIATYPGMYDPVKFYNVTTPPTPVSQQTYSYYEPGSEIPMMNYSNYTTYDDQPGKETDIAIDRRAVEENSKETRTTGDITVGVVPFIIPIVIPYPIAFPVTSVSNARLNTIVVSKVIHYPAIVKEVTTMKDGFVQRTDNMAFDPYTAKPVVTCTYDGYNGLYLEQDGADAHNGTYTTYNVPAASQYTSMGQKAWNEKYCYYANPTFNISGSAGSYTVPGANTNGIFKVGDLIALYYQQSGVTSVAMANVMSISGADLNVSQAGMYNSSLLTSVPYNKVEIVRSGYTNQLSSMAGSFTMYGKTGVMDIAGFDAAINTAIAHIQTAPPNTTIVVDFSKYGIADAFGIKSITYTKNPSGTYTTTIYSPGGTAYPINSTTTPGLATTSSALLQCIINITPGSLTAPYTCPSLTYKQNALVYNYSCGGICNLKECVYPSCFDTIPTSALVKANITTYSDAVPESVDLSAYTTTNWNAYETGQKGKWRPWQNYVYRNSTMSGNGTSGRTYKDAGTTPFNLNMPWINYPASDPKQINWVRSSQVTNYSGNGDAIEEIDVDSVYNAAKYGYRGILPYLVAQNARNASVHFESFENLYGSQVEEQMPVIPTHVVKGGHTGRYGYNLYNGEQLALPAAQDPNGKGLLLRFWAQTTGSLASTFIVTASGTSVPVTYVGRSGDWALYEARWNNTSGTPANITFTILNTGSAPYMFDDIRVQPPEAKMTAYVYDVNTYKVMAEMDDQNFATYFQYNGEGKLVRKLYETQRGIKTAEEVQYHTPQTKK